MKNYQLPDMGQSGSGRDASSVILGMMRIEDLTDRQIKDLVAAALDSGVSMFDHADLYGSSRHACEQRFGSAVSLSSSQRDQVLLQSKVGIMDGYHDFSKEHILSSVDESLKALGTDYLDSLLLHRPDILVQPEEVAAAFDELESTGKVKQFGVSNHTPGQVELLKTAVKQPLRFNQLQLSITHAPIMGQGTAMNMADEPQSVDRSLGILDYCRINSVTIQAWSPYQKGFLNGVFLGDMDEYPELNRAIEELAEEYSVTPTGIATAWITTHPANIQVVLGTTKPERVAQAAQGADVTLTREQWYRLYTLGGQLLP